jgi:hypothetical protein
MNSVNTPDRISLDAFADPDRPNNAVYSSFTNNLGVAVLNAKQLHLLRATIPNINLQIPDYSLVFFYYRLPNATTVPSSTHLRMVRLYPASYQPPINYTTFTRNTYFTTPADLATTLTTAAAAGGDSIFYNKLWTSGDVTFAYSTTTRQITFTGTAATVFYANAGWNDPNVLAVVNNFVRVTPSQVVTNGSIAVYSVPSTAGLYVGNPITVTGCATAALNGTFTITAKVADTSITVSSTVAAATATFTNGLITSTPNMVLTYNYDTTNSIQPMVAGVTLNQRLGYGLSGTCVPPQGGTLLFNNLIANLTGVARANGTAVPVDSYPCLVYTGCIYLYANLVGNTGLGNYGRKNLLAVVAVTNGAFEVIQFIGSYNGGEAHPIPEEIYSFSIEMRDDNNQPFFLPDTANVNVELAIDYGLPPYL